MWEDPQQVKQYAKKTLGLGVGRKAVERMKFRADETVLDVGCGGKGEEEGKGEGECGGG